MFSKLTHKRVLETLKLCWNSFECPGFALMYCVHKNFMFYRPSLRCTKYSYLLKNMKTKTFSSLCFTLTSVPNLTRFWAYFVVDLHQHRFMGVIVISTLDCKHFVFTFIRIRRMLPHHPDHEYVEQQLNNLSSKFLKVSLRENIFLF